MYTGCIAFIHQLNFTMRLKKLPPKEPIIRVTLGLRASTSEQLDAYQANYLAVYGEPIDRSNLTEQMLLDYMANDREFQKTLAAKPAAV